MMRRVTPMAAAALVFAGACAPHVEPRDHIIFQHGPHLAAGASCVRCHAAAAPADGGMPDANVPDAGVAPADGGVPAAAHGRPLLPAEADCRTCHSNPARDRCERCHTAPERAATYAQRDDGIHFDHAAHSDPEIGRCVSCHGREGGSERAFEPVRPTMERCTSACHEDDMRALRCVRCHADLHRYRIDDVSLLRHPPGFLHRHGTTARVDTALCTQCHEPSFCEECHRTAPGAPLEVWLPSLEYRDFVHRGDFLSRHATEADLERGTCARCHGIQFCDGCHRESGIGGGVAPGSPHPAGWLDPLSPFGHAQAARRDLLSCVSCHEADAERTCVPCHRVGGVAGNPHPPGFGAGMDPRSYAVCRACHVP